MNLILLEAHELGAPLPLSDPRAQHILKVLRRAPGDTFVAGVVDGPQGVATLREIDATAGALRLEFSPTGDAPPPPPVTLLLGLPRPQTARDILRDATTLGVARIHFVATERGDPNYAASSLWTSGEWRRHVLAGAAQACDTRLPRVDWTLSLAEACRAAHAPPAAPPLRLALDPYEATRPLANALGWHRPKNEDASPAPLVLALGPERGWGPRDREILRAAGFVLCSLGNRILRLETAVVAALSLARADAR